MRGRLEIVGSDMMYLVPLSQISKHDSSILAHLNDATKADMPQRYPLSKLLVFYSVRELAQRCDGNTVTIIDMTPGLCHSDIFREDMSAIGTAAMALSTWVVGRTTEDGGRTLVHGISPDLLVEAHGRFMMDAKIAA